MRRYLKFAGALMGAALSASVILFSINSIKVCASEHPSYTAYCSTLSGSTYSGDTIVCKSDASTSEKITSISEPVTVTVDAPIDALYVIGVDYRCLGENILQTSISLKVNGEVPYEELEHLFFSDTWVTGEKLYDRYGNESIAMPSKSDEWSFTYLRDTYFLQNEPLMVFLNKGENTLEFLANEGRVEIGDIYLETPVEIPDDPTPDDPIPEEELGGSGNLIIIEAEDFSTRNSPNIRTLADFNTSVTPYDPKLKVQNVIDEASFKIGGTSVEYEIDVEEEGLYYMAFDYLQSSKSNFTVYRNIYIDGNIPSKSYENVAFPYTTKYKRKKSEVPVYLTKGHHKLTLEVAIEPYGEAVSELSDIVEEINDLALSVNKITGGNTNKYRDFDLEEYGLDIENKLNGY